MTTHLILGIGGQDGSYLADILTRQEEKVHGLYRRSSVNNLRRIEHLRDKIALHQGDITDTLSLKRIIEEVQPDVIYNVADQDHVGWSLHTPSYSFDVTAKPLITICEAALSLDNGCRVFQPCSSTMFGDAPAPQTEETPFNPQSPYAIAKVAAYYIAQHYREVHQLPITVGIMYNHDSERRGSDYLLHQIARQCWDVAKKKTDTITVGDPEMPVDIGYAKDFMDIVVQLMSKQFTSGNYIISTGRGVPIKQWIKTIEVCIEELLTYIYLPLRYEIKTDKSLLRPGKQPILVGSINKLKTALPNLISLRPNPVYLGRAILEQERTNG